MQPRGTTRVADLARARLRRNEELVVAENALNGERRVAVVRIAMSLLFAISNELIPRVVENDHISDTPTHIVGTAYMVFAIVTLVALYKARPDARKSRTIPLVVAAVDFSTISYMAYRDYAVDGHVYPEMGAIAFAILLSFAVTRFSLLHVVVSTILACVCSLALVMTFDIFAVRPALFVTMGYVALGVMMAVTNVAVSRMFRDLRRRDELTRFLPNAVAERVLAEGGATLAPHQREVTILFSDIRGFTGLSETKNPSEVFDFLDQYFGTMVQIVQGRDGVVNKFLGDGLLAFWGAPDPDPKHAENAVNAALDMRRAIVELNRERTADGEPPLAIGIGVHTGVVAAGMLGSTGQSEYTVIGDAVNVASRIEALTKTHGVDLLISESTWMLCDGAFDGKRLAEAPVRGRTEPVVLYTIPEQQAV